MSDFIWVEKYSPDKIDDCILPTSIKKTFQGFVDAGEIPIMLAFLMSIAIRKVAILL